MQNWKNWTFVKNKKKENPLIKLEISLQLYNAYISQKNVIFVEVLLCLVCSRLRFAWFSRFNFFNWFLRVCVCVPSVMKLSTFYCIFFCFTVFKTYILVTLVLVLFKAFCRAALLIVFPLTSGEKIAELLLSVISCSSVPRAMSRIRALISAIPLALPLRLPFPFSWSSTSFTLAFSLAVAFPVAIVVVPKIIPVYSYFSFSYRLK